MTQETDTVQTRPDGSIDMEFYLAKGRLARSRQAHGFLKGAAQLPGTVSDPAFVRLWNILSRKHLRQVRT